jgi:hypothetical protein
MSTSLEPSPLPTRHAIRNLVESLVGRDVDLTDTNPISASATNLVAVYVTDTNAVAAVAVLDLAGAARLGGALGLLPRAGVDDAIEEKTLSGTQRDNAYEVMNVMAAVFNVENAQHVRLYELYGPDGNVPNDVLALSQVIGTRMDVLLTISGYGDVRLSIITR